jgi:YcxB-like protein
MITIKYALTRAEILRVFLVGLRKSPRILAVVLCFSFLPGVTSLASASLSSGVVTIRDVMIALGWTVGMFCLVVVMIFVRGKTAERTLSVTEQGFSTQIGSINAQRPWTKVKEIKDAGSYILIVSKSGNSFFVPSRAFSGPDERNQFLSDIRHWHASA